MGERIGAEMVAAVEHKFAAFIDVGRGFASPQLWSRQFGFKIFSLTPFYLFIYKFESFLQMSNSLMEKKELTEEMSKKEMMDYLIEVKPKMAAVVPTLDKEQISKLYRIVRK